MLIVAGSFTVEPSLRDEFIGSRLDAMRASRAEPGCLEYVFGADPIDPGRVVLFERWESKEALAVHLAAMKDAPKRTDSVPFLGAEVVQYEISAEGRVGS